MVVGLYFRPSMKPRRRVCELIENPFEAFRWAGLRFPFSPRRLRSLNWAAVRFLREEEKVGFDLAMTPSIAERQTPMASKAASRRSSASWRASVGLSSTAGPSFPGTRSARRRRATEAPWRSTRQERKRRHRTVMSSPPATTSYRLNPKSGIIA